MAESLESRVKHLRSRVESLKQLYSNKEKPLAVDLEIQVLQEQIANLAEPTVEQNMLH